MKTSLKINLVEHKTVVQTNSSQNGSGKKWDKRLDDFENYTKEYLSHYKKSLKGNTASLCIYPYMKAKTEDLAKMIYAAYHKSKLTEQQIKRLKKIHSKIVSSCC